jgi:SAM-dependent methyltransferase
VIGIKDIKNYEDYVSLQKEKTEDPKRREKWEGKLNENTDAFIPTFLQYVHKIEEYKQDSVYCLGARTGEEALALRKLGFEKAFGTDLVPFSDHVIEDDIHNMQFQDNSVGLFYTNIFDHSIDPRKFLSEIFRCLKVGGAAFFQLQIGSQLDKYGVLFIDNPKDFESLALETGFSIFKSEKNEVLTPHNHGLNWNIILEKK